MPVVYRRFDHPYMSAMRPGLPPLHAMPTYPPAAVPATGPLFRGGAPGIVLPPTKGPPSPTAAGPGQARTIPSPPLSVARPMRYRG